METTISTGESKQIAAEILRQLGGNRFLAMTGSRPQYCNGYESCYKLTRNKAKAQYMKVFLNAMDTYDLTFQKITTGGEVVTVANRTGIYNDQLQRIFTEITGLYTHL